jgi:hypothetical protein
LDDLNKRIATINRRIGQLIQAQERETARRYAKVLITIRAEMAKQYEQFEKDGKLSLQEMLKHDRLKKLNARVEFLLNAHYKGFNEQLTKALGDAYKGGYYLTANALEMHIKKKIGYRGVTKETLKAMLDNPVNGLTLNQRLERRRVYIIQQIQRQITLGLQGNESYSSMAKRLKGELEGDAVKAMRIVRTEGHRVQESAKHDAMEFADKNGVVMMKQWNSLEDERVRKRPKSKADHKKLNNKKIAMDKLFDDGLSKGLAPGQLPAAASSINCRCFLTYSVEKVERRDLKDIEDATFGQWAKDNNIKDAPPLTKKDEPKSDPPPKKEPEKKPEPPKVDPMAKMYEEENKIRDLKKETGIIFDTDGNEVWRQKGQTANVDIMDAVNKGVMKGNILTHNHPRGSSFSDSDIKVLSFYEMAEIRAVSNKHTYTAKLTDKFMQYDKFDRKKMIEAKVKEYDDEVKKELSGTINGKELTQREADLERWHRIWTKMAERDGWITYKREKFGEKEQTPPKEPEKPKTWRDATTADEVKDLFSKEHTFYYSEGVDFDADVIKGINNRIEGVYKKFPEIKTFGRMLDAKDGGVDEGALAYVYKNAGRFGKHVTMVHKEWSNMERLKKNHAHSVQQGFLVGEPGMDVYSLITHEYGHVMVNYLNANKYYAAIGEKEKDAADYIKETALKELKMHPYQIAGSLSTYGTYNNDETVAESFAEYVDADKPRPFASKVGEIITNLLKKMRG